MTEFARYDPADPAEPEGQLAGIARLIGAASFPQAVILLARGFLSAYQASPRLSSLFATQQRWLLCHAAIAEYFKAVRAGRPGPTRRDLVQCILRNGIASRNTMQAFLDEARQYGIMLPMDAGTEALGPSPAALSLLAGWYAGHFQALDMIDGGDRHARFLAGPEILLAVMQPLVAEALLTSPEVRVPGPLYAIFTWADAGGLLMDRLVCGIDPQALVARERIATDVTAISHLAEAFGLSRPHTGRKLAAAETIGGIGWTGRRGRSPIWISRGFYDEYAQAQARKLVILDTALGAALTA